MAQTLKRTSNNDLVKVIESPYDLDSQLLTDKKNTHNLNFNPPIEHSRSYDKGRPGAERFSNLSPSNQDEEHSPDAVSRPSQITKPIIIHNVATPEKIFIFSLAEFNF